MNEPTSLKRIDPLKATGKQVLGLRPFIPGKPVEELKSELGLDEIIKLSTNECPLEMPKGVVRAIAENAEELGRYPDAYCGKLRARLSERLGVPPECFLFGNGAEECILLIALAFLNPGDVAIFPVPGFDAYASCTVLAKGEVRRVPLKDFRLDFDAILDATDERTKILWICSPNNPTGTVVSKKDMDRFLDRLPDDKVVVLDEAYHEFVTDPNKADATDYLEKDGRVVGIRTFSKAFSLAGLRVGYIMAHPKIVEVLAKVKPPFNVNTLAQAAAVRAMDEEEFVRDFLEMVRLERGFLQSELEKRGLRVVPSEANFLFVRTPMDGDALFAGLRVKGVLVRSGSAFGTPDFIRVTVGTRRQNERFLSALDASLSAAAG